MPRTISAWTFALLLSSVDWRLASSNDNHQLGLGVQQ